MSPAQAAETPRGSASWPGIRRRLLAREGAIRQPGRAPSPLRPPTPTGDSLLAPPVTFLDLLDRVLRQSKVVANFVDECLPNGDDDIVLRVAVVFDRLLKERDLVGQHVAMRPGTLCQ